MIGLQVFRVNNKGGNIYTGIPKFASYIHSLNVECKVSIISNERRFNSGDNKIKCGFGEYIDLFAIVQTSGVSECVVKFVC